MLNKNITAFSLIELLITLAIVALIVGVALPSYQQKVIEANKTEAIEALQLIMQAQERYYGDNGTYTFSLTDLGYTSNTVRTAEDRYTISASACAADIQATECVQLTASAQGKQVDSGDLLYNSRGSQWKIITKNETTTVVDHW